MSEAFYRKNVCTINCKNLRQEELCIDLHAKLLQKDIFFIFLKTARQTGITSFISLCSDKASVLRKNWYSRGGVTNPQL